MWTELLKGAARQAARQGTLPSPTGSLLAQIWPTLVGEVLARRSRPVSLEDKTLHLEVDHVNLVREWSLHSLPLLARIRQFSPWPVERLHVSYNPQLTPQEGPQGSAPRRDQSPQAKDQTITGPTAPGVDEELQRLIDSISRHRSLRGDDK